MVPTNHGDQSSENDDDDDDDASVRPCTPQSRKAGKKCISLYDCRYEIGFF